MCYWGLVHLSSFNCGIQIDRYFILGIELSNKLRIIRSYKVIYPTKSIPLKCILQVWITCQSGQINMGILHNIVLQSTHLDNSVVFIINTLHALHTLGKNLEYLDLIKKPLEHPKKHQHPSQTRVYLTYYHLNKYRMHTLTPPQNGVR